MNSSALLLALGSPDASTYAAPYVLLHTTAECGETYRCSLLAIEPVFAVSAVDAAVPITVSASHVTQEPLSDNADVTLAEHHGEW
jgi:hypothetical protein